MLISQCQYLYNSPLLLNGSLFLNYEPIATVIKDTEMKNNWHFFILLTSFVLML